MQSNIRKEIEELYGATYKSDMGANNHDLWLAMYRGEYPWVDATEVVSLNLATVIASELARLTTLEMEVKIGDDIMADHIKPVVDKARRFTEYGLALGDIILKPYPVGDKFAVDYVTPDMYVPISFDSFGRLTHVVFPDRLIKRVDDDLKFYTRLEEHLITPHKYTISNKFYVSDTRKSLGDPTTNKNIDEWADLVLSLEADHVNYPLFGHFKNPQANNLDLRSPLGISCFSKATSLIQDADEQYSRIIWEYTGSELAIDADITALEKSGMMPKHGDRLFRNLGLASTGKPDGLYEVFSPAIRDASLFNGLNQILRRIEYVCDLAYGTISDPQNVDKTAEEIRSSKQRSYATVADIQKSLERAFEELVRAIHAWGYILKNQTPPDEIPEIGFDWDDSLVIDSLAEQQIRMQEVAAGLTTPVAYRMWRYGESEEDALKNLPGVAPESYADYGEE